MHCISCQLRRDHKLLYDLPYQVQTDTAGFCTEQEDEAVIPPSSVESIHQLESLLLGRTAIQAECGVPLRFAHFGNDVQRRGEVGNDDDLFICVLMERVQHAIQCEQLA